MEQGRIDLSKALEALQPSSSPLVEMLERGIEKPEGWEPRTWKPSLRRRASWRWWAIRRRIALLIAPGLDDY